MVEKPIVFLPLVWTFALNVLPQPLQNLTVKLAIDGLTRGYKFLVDNALDVEKNYQHGLDIAANLTHFFWPRWIWRFPLQRLLLSLRVITIHPCFITGYDIGDEVGVVSGLFFQFPADRNVKGLLVITNLAEMCLMFKLSAKMCWMVPYDNRTISQTLWIICLRSARITSRTFAMFSGVVLVDGCPERSSLLTDVCPSLKCLYHKKVLLWHMALSPKASCNSRWASAAVFFKAETKFDADSLLLKIGHIRCKKNSPDH